MRTAVIVTTYNRLDALAAVLDGYAAQDTLDFELIVADDGSTGDTRELIGRYEKKAPFALRHVWQEDRGFRAAAIRNRALASAAADYVIFSDGDCVPGRAFVRRHRALAEPGFFLAGSRILLSERFTSEVLARRLPIHSWDAPAWIAARLRGDVNRLLPLLRVPDNALRKSSPRQWRGARTCNLSAWRGDLLRVNGLDESYSGWGLEDSDLVIRLFHAGVKHKSARFAAPVFHLWHREQDRGRLPENQRLLQDLLRSGRTSALIGVEQYL
jgi:glycosyltransferase involved in cell wall biosynthesis